MDRLPEASVSKSRDGTIVAVIAPGLWAVRIDGKWTSPNDWRVGDMADFVSVNDAAESAKLLSEARAAKSKAISLRIAHEAVRNLNAAVMAESPAQHQPKTMQETLEALQKSTPEQWAAAVKAAEKPKLPVPVVFPVNE